MNVIQTSFGFVNSVVAELRKVTYPTPQQVAVRTLIVVVTIAIATVIIGLLDAGIGEALKVVVLKRGA